MIDSLKKILVLTAHSDDEMICAGTLHRLARQGARIQVVCFSPAATVEDRRGTEKSSTILRPEWERSMDLIGVAREDRYFLGMTPSADFQKFRQEICQTIFDLCEFERPDAVFTLSPDDENVAHAIVGVESERVLRGRVSYAIRCQYPWNFSMGRPNLFVKLDEQDLMCKKKVIAAYASQAFRYRYGEMLVHQCLADGMSVKVEAAEKFELIRAVV